MSGKISFGDAVQMHIINKNNSKDHKLIGPLYAHLVGPIVVPAARVVDIVRSIFEALGDVFGKVVWGIVLLPINSVRWLFNKGTIENCFSVSRGVESAGKAFIYLGGIPRDAISNFIDPNWNVSKEEISQLTAEKQGLELEIKRLMDENVKLLKQLKEDGSKTSSTPSSSSGNLDPNPASRANLLSDIQNGRKPSEIKRTPLLSQTTGTMSPSTSSAAARTQPSLQNLLEGPFSARRRLLQGKGNQPRLVVSAFEELIAEIKKKSGEELSSEEVNGFIETILSDYDGEKDFLAAKEFPSALDVSQYASKADLIRYLEALKDKVEDEIRAVGTRSRVPYEPPPISTAEKIEEEQVASSSEPSSSTPEPEPEEPKTIFGVQLRKVT